MVMILMIIMGMMVVGNMMTSSSSGDNDVDSDSNCNCKDGCIRNGGHDSY